MGFAEAEQQATTGGQMNFAWKQINDGIGDTIFRRFRRRDALCWGWGKVVWIGEKVLAVDYWSFDP